MKFEIAHRSVALYDFVLLEYYGIHQHAPFHQGPGTHSAGVLANKSDISDIQEWILEVVIQGLKHLCYADRLRELELLRSEKRTLREDLRAAFHRDDQRAAAPLL